MRCWNAPNSVGLTLALALACRTAPVGVSDLDLSSRGRLIRIEDTRRIEAAFLDSALRAPDASMRRAAALTAGRVGARAQTTEIANSSITTSTARKRNPCFRSILAW